MNIWTRAYLAFVLFSIGGLSLGRLTQHSVQPSGPIVIIGTVTAAMTLVVGLVAVYRSAQTGMTERSPLGLIGLILLGTTVEILGVRTGFPFGDYAYTDRWRPVLDLPGIGFFPVQLPLAWAMMVTASTLVAVRFGAGGWPRWVYAGISGLIAAAVDLAMEPVMSGPLNYWRWVGRGPLPGGVPILNSLGWFVTATLGAAILLQLGIRAAWKSRDGQYILAAHLLLLAGIWLTR